LPLPHTDPLATLPSLRLPDHNREDWSRDASLLAFPDYRDLNAWNAFGDASVDLARRHLPTRVAEALHEFFAPAGAAVLIVENLPIDRELPPIPADGMRP